MNDLIEVTFEDMILRVEKSDSDGRTLSGYIVPWDRPAAVVKPTKGLEVYKRGALTKTTSELSESRQIHLLESHNSDKVLGRMLHSYADEFGHYAIFTLADTQRARDAAELVRADLVTGLSIGGYGVPARTKVMHEKDGMTLVERSEIILDHVALVRKPAFDDARVLALRAAEEEEEPSPPVDLAAVVAERRARREAMISA